MNIQNKVVLVTGASRGIGMAIATELSDKGAIVIGTATSVDGASNISKTLSAQERKGEGMVLDVNNNDSITNLIKQLMISMVRFKFWSIMLELLRIIYL